MKLIFYFQVWCQLIHLLKSARGNCRNGHVESFYLREEFCKNDDEKYLYDFLTSADIMIKSDCSLIDTCSRITDVNLDDYQVADFIVVGGGVAGPVVAGRLSEVKDWKVVLLESGPEQPAAIDIPGLWSSAVGTKYDWKYKTVKQQKACLMNDGVCDWPRGKVLGGTAVLSGSMYSRGHRSIYDSWGDGSWGYDAIVEYFKKSERNADYASDFHGHAGPISVRKPAETLAITRALTAAAAELGYDGQLDMSDPAQPNGFAVAQTMADGRNARVSTPTAYLRPRHVRSRDNLQISLNSHATRLVLDGRRGDGDDAPRVVGVEYADRANRTRVLLARKEVILSAGVIGSAHVLMLSGIGPAEDLRRHGVPVVRDLRVGRNLQHHVSAALRFELTNATDGDRALSHAALVEYVRRRGGPLSTTGALQTSAFLRSDAAADPRAAPADLQLFFDGFSVPTDGNDCHRLRIRDRHNCDAPDPAAAATLDVRPVNVLPKSRGAVTLASADPFARPLIDPNYFAVDSDVDVLVEGLKIVLKLARTRPLREMGIRLRRIAVPQCDDRYEYMSDEYFRCYVMHASSGENHHAGTCSMGGRPDRGAVVDFRLKVHGVEGVRVVDASVIPLQPNCNPIAPIVMIAEKAADLIKREYEIKDQRADN